MSKAVIPIRTVALQDPVTRLGRPTAWGVPQGGIVYTAQQVQATTYSGAGNGNINWVCPPPSPEIIVDRKVFMRVQLFLEFQAVPAPGVPVLQLGLNDGPRAFPLMQAINTINATINNNTISALMDPIPALMRYNLPFDLQRKDYSSSPAMLDQYQEYDFYNGIPQAQQAASPFNFNMGGGNERNPLQPYGDSMVTSNRGGFMLQVVANPIGDGISLQTAAVILTVIEPIFMTPFTQWGEEVGFYGIQTLNINAVLNQNWWQRTWCSNIIKTGAVITAPVGSYTNAANPLIAPVNPVHGTLNPTINMSGSLGPGGSGSSAPTLLFRYITPSPIYPLPPMMEYPFTAVNVYQTSVQNVPTVFATTATQSTPSNAIQFNTIPDKIFVYLQRQSADRNQFTADTFASIQSVSINFMNQTGLMASWTQLDLYKACCRNGFDGTFDQWRWEVGSVLCIAPGKDLGLEPSLAPGMNGLYNFQITVNYVNPSAYPVNYTLYVVTLTSGLVTIKDNGTVTQTGLITREDVLSAQTAPSMSYQEAVQLVGGDFFGNLKNILSRGADTISSVGKYALPILDKASYIPGPVGALASQLHRYGNTGLDYLGRARKTFGFGMRGRGFGPSQVGQGAAEEGQYYDDCEGDYDPAGDGVGLEAPEPERRPAPPRRRFEEMNQEPVILSRRNPAAQPAALDPRAAPQFR